MNFVCIDFELGDKMLTLSSMVNQIVPDNLKIDHFIFTKLDINVQKLEI